MQIMASPYSPVLLVLMDETLADCYKQVFPVSGAFAVHLGVLDEELLGRGRQTSHVSKAASVIFKPSGGSSFSENTSSLPDEVCLFAQGQITTGLAPKIFGLCTNDIGRKREQVQPQRRKFRAAKATKHGWYQQRERSR